MLDSFVIAAVKFLFFFQAEDGIRDLIVTGVQTCALPIQAEDGIRDLIVTGVQTCALPISSHDQISYAVFCLKKKKKSTRLNSSHDQISYAVFCLKKKKEIFQLQSSIHVYSILGLITRDVHVNNEELRK